MRQREQLQKLHNRLSDLKTNLEDKIQEQTEEIKRAYEVEKRARAELERVDKAREQFMLTTQHHLRTPLTIIRGYVRALLEGVGDVVAPEMRHSVERVEEATGLLMRITNKLLFGSEEGIRKKDTPE